MTTTSQAIERTSDKPDAMVGAYRDDFALVLPSHINADQWVRTAQGIVRRNPALLAAAKKNPGSFMASMLRCAHLGLEPGDTFHLVPFGNEITGITDYKGEIELMHRAGEVVSVKVDVVHALDEFDWAPGEMDKPVHRPPAGENGKPNWFADRGEMVGAYGYAEMRSGAISKVVVMSALEIEQHKKVSKTASSSSSPWAKWPKSMWLKTVVKELRKWVPTSPEYRAEVLRQGAALHEVSTDLRDLPVEHDFPDDDEVVDGELIDEPAS